MEEVLRIEDLQTYFFTDEGTVRAVDVSPCPSARPGHSAWSANRAAANRHRPVGPPARAGAARQDRRRRHSSCRHGHNYVLSRDRDARHPGAGWLSMIFQEPMTSLNPVFTIGSQVMGGGPCPYRTGAGKGGAGHRRRLPCESRHTRGPAAQRMSEYPHQLSGGYEAAGDDSHGALPQARRS